MAEEKAKPSENTTVSVVTAIYLVVLSLISICGSLAFIGLGSLFGGVAGLGTAELGAELDAEGQAILAEVAGVGGLATIIGIVTLIVGIAALITAVGLFMKKDWAYMAAIVVNAIYIVVTILGMLTGGGINVVSIIFIVISGIIIYLFMTHEPTKQVFGKA